MEHLADLISKYGFPAVACIGIAGIVYYVWKWVSTEIKPVTDETHETLIKLVDKIRMLDNDLIRLHQKVNVILSLKEKEKEETPKKEDK